MHSRQDRGQDGGLKISVRVSSLPSLLWGLGRDSEELVFLPAKETWKQLPSELIDLFMYDSSDSLYGSVPDPVLEVGAHRWLTCPYPSGGPMREWMSYCPVNYTTCILRINISSVIWHSKCLWQETTIMFRSPAFGVRPGPLTSCVASMKSLSSLASVFFICKTGTVTVVRVFWGERFPQRTVWRTKWNDAPVYRTDWHIVSAQQMLWWWWWWRQSVF